MAQTHYLWFDSNGEIKGISPGTLAWDGDPLSGTPTDPSHAKNCRDNQITENGLAGGVSDSCACDLGDYSCTHAGEAQKTKYVADPLGTPALTSKPALTILVDAVSHPEDDATPINKTPGATVTLKLQATVPDGTTVTLKRDGALVAENDIVLTFTSNETNQVNITAPAQGQLGGLYGVGKLVRPVVVNLLGWA